MITLNPKNMLQNEITNQVYKVEQVGSHFKMIDVNGNSVGTLGATSGTRKKAHLQGKALKQIQTKNGKSMFRLVDLSLIHI